MKLTSHPVGQGAVVFIAFSGLIALFALSMAVAEALSLSRSATTDGVVRKGQSVGARACVAEIHFQTAEGKEFVYQQYREQGRLRGALPPRCPVGEIVPLAYDPGDPGRTVKVAGRGYEAAKNLLPYAGIGLLLGLYLRKQALQRES